MTEFWNMKAKSYGQMENKGAERAEQVISKLLVDPETSIVDIGCGPGSLSIPLAKTAGTVTAIDPAYAMLDQLKEKASDENLSNIATINKKWEDISVGIDVAPHDVVVASYSLAMADIREALSKMNEAAIRGVCLFWFAGKRGWINETLWPKLFGEDYIPGPDYIYLLNVLYQIGIHPNLEITKRTHEQRFPSMEEALKNWRENLPDLTPEQDAILKKHIEETLHLENGTFYFRNEIKSAMIWWQKEAV